MERADDHDEARLLEYAAALADAIDDALPRWIVSSVEQRCRDAGMTVPIGVRADAERAALAASDTVGPQIRMLLSSDLDEQRSTPLALLRGATSYATDVLRSAGVPAVDRDDFARRSFPDDDYALSPAAFSDVDPALHEPGLVWGAAKAHVHLARRRAAGQR